MKCNGNYLRAEQVEVGYVPWVTLDDLVRETIQELRRLGVQQKIIAKYMGMTPPNLNRWIKGKVDIALKTTNVEGLEAYLIELKNRPHLLLNQKNVIDESRTGYARGIPVQPPVAGGKSDAAAPDAISPISGEDRAIQPPDPGDVDDILRFLNEFSARLIQLGEEIHARRETRHAREQAAKAGLPEPEEHSSDRTFGRSSPKDG